MSEKKKDKKYNCPECKGKKTMEWDKEVVNFMCWKCGHIGRREK